MICRNADFLFGRGPLRAAVLTGLLLTALLGGGPEANAQQKTKDGWQHLSTEKGDLPAPNGGDQQTSTAVADVDGDDVNDFFITERTLSPSVVWYQRTDQGWTRRVVDDEPLPIEAGSTTHDIDGDGDPDLVAAGDAQSNKVWWWENPAPNFDASRPWTRRLVAETAGPKHHDQRFGEVDDDGEAELIFWNQGAQRLYLANVPDDPRTAGLWPTEVIYTYGSDSQMEQRGSYPGWKGTNEHEGLDMIDIDGDGTLDIVAGGRWFKRLQDEGSGDGRYRENIIDASYPFSRAAGGALLKGGRPEVALVVGDGRGPLMLYEYQEGTWEHTTLIDTVQDGHSLDVVDFNGDGHMDIFVAEMRLGENPDAKTWLLLGDGQGTFRRRVVASGYGLHEAKLVDLDGDGDLDILGKPYTWKAPRLDLWLNKEKEAGGENF
jgi:hypothetical protein